MKKTQRILSGFTSIALVASLAAGSAMADENTNTQSASDTASAAASSATQSNPAASATSTVTEEATSGKGILDKLSLSYVGYFFGPAINNPLSSMQPDAVTGEASEPLNTQNYLVAGYKLTPELTLSPTLVWTLSPVREHKAALADPYLRLSHSKVVNAGSFNLGADVRAYAPVSEGSQKKGLITKIGMKQTASMDLGTSGFSVGLITFESASIFRDFAGKTPFYFAATPSVDYKILSNLSAWVSYDIDTTGYQALSPGLSWDILPTLNFSPYLDIKTGGKVALNTTSLAAVLSWKML